MWLYLAVFVVALIISAAAAFLFRPKGPPPPNPATLEDIDVPVAEEGKTIGVVFGTVDLEDQNVVEYGNLYTDPIRLKAGGKK
ncbi:MAG: hypothetical protein ACU843_12630 [Gammaproteobacteria bacterium]